MVVEKGFPLPLNHTKVKVFQQVWCFDRRLVDCVNLSTFPFHQAFFFFFFYSCMSGQIWQTYLPLFVTCFDDTFYVISRAKITFTVFLLKTLCSLLDLGKCLSSKQKKVLAVFVDTFLLHGVLNQMICRDLFLVSAFCCCFLYFNLVWNPTSVKDFSYSGLYELNFSSFDEFFLKVFLLCFLETE